MKKVINICHNVVFAIKNIKKLNGGRFKILLHLTSKSRSYSHAAYVAKMSMQLLSNGGRFLPELSFQF